MTNIFGICETLGALEKGVLVPTCNVQKELSKLSPEEARAAKRKWRKIMRRAAKRIQRISPEETGASKNKPLVRHFARKILREKGQKTLGLK
jgi:hypothetical protein